MLPNSAESGYMLLFLSSLQDELFPAPLPAVRLSATAGFSLGSFQDQTQRVPLAARPHDFPLNLYSGCQVLVKTERARMGYLLLRNTAVAGGATPRLEVTTSANYSLDVGDITMQR